MFATGFCMEVLRTRERAAGETDEFLSDLARQFGIWVIGGLVRAISGGRARNEVVVFGPTGRERASFAKLHLFSPARETEACVPGDEIQTFVCEGWVVSPFICYDLRFPEAFRLAARRGAQLFVVPANWPEPRIEHWVVLLRARAIENQAYVVGVNRLGTDASELPYPGRSLVIDPLGQVLLDAGAQEGVFQAAIDLAVLQAWRDRFPAWRDMRFI
jgi:predicted amidohydrolase